MTTGKNTNIWLAESIIIITTRKDSIKFEKIRRDFNQFTNNVNIVDFTQEIVYQ